MTEFTLALNSPEPSKGPVTVDTSAVQKGPALNEDQFLMLCYMEQRFWETGYLPTNEIVQRDLRLSSKSIDEAWKNSTFRNALQVRGIDLSAPDTVKVLSPTQMMLANRLLNAYDKRSVREKLEELDVSPQQYNAWKRQPAFAEYLRKRAEAVYQGADSTAYLKLVEAVEEGDTNALKLFFEMRGIHNPRLQVDVNIQGVMVKVVEIVSKHVRDPLVLNAIAEDMTLLAKEVTA